MSKAIQSSLLSIAILLLFAPTVFAQYVPDPNGDAASKAPTPRSRLSRSHARQVTVELNRQQKFLRDVASRYEAVSEYDFTPLLSYSYVWIALRENRDRLADPQRRLTPAQSELVRSAYDLLETDVLLLFLDHQLTVLSETLELSELQNEAMHKTLTDDLNQRQALVSSKGIDGKMFGQRINALSQQTEKKILSILFPEQRKKFEKQLTLSKDRLIA